jgi:hypothetical protein
MGASGGSAAPADGPPPSCERGAPLTVRVRQLGRRANAQGSNATAEPRNTRSVAAQG